MRPMRYFRKKRCGQRAILLGDSSALPATWGLPESALTEGRRALTESWILEFSSSPGRSWPLLSSPCLGSRPHRTALSQARWWHRVGEVALCAILSSLCLVARSAWKLPIFRPTGQRKVPKPFLLSLVALANL